MKAENLEAGVKCAQKTPNVPLLALQVVDYYRKEMPVISKSETTFKVAFIERHHKRRIENYNELLEWCNTELVLPPGSSFKAVECVPLNLDNADRYLHTLAEMQTIDVLVSHVVLPTNSTNRYLHTLAECQTIDVLVSHVVFPTNRYLYTPAEMQTIDRESGHLPNKANTTGTD